MTIHLGPVSPAIDPAPPRNPRTDGYGDNPRCLRRDISNLLSSKYSRPQDIANLITNSKSIGPFQDTMQSTAPIGVHVAGHYTIAGDPGGDFYTSPNDPAFWVHHAMIDRTWSIWQTQDLPNRLAVIAGGTDMMGGLFGGGGRQQSLDDVVDFGVVGVNGARYKIRELVSTVDGPFCYVYE
jgi:tyrosinase